jgi:hypothetical protein
MKPSRPRALAHRGVIDAVAFVIDDALVGEREARRRCLALWAPGATIRRVGARRVVRLPRPVAVRHDQAPGAPLASDKGLLVAAPGLGALARAAGAGEGSAALIEAGELRLLGPTEGALEDPAAWLDLDDFTVVTARAAGAPAAATAARFEPVPVDVRRVLGKLPEASPRVAEIAEALARASEKPRIEAEAPPASLALLGQALQWLSLMIARLSGALQSAAARGAAGASRGAGQASPPGAAARGLIVRGRDAPAGPGLLDRLSERLNHLAARFLVATRLAGQIGRRQAEYMGRMMEMFEKGQLDEALRHAIPLGKDGASGGQLISFGVPLPRTDLQIQAGGAGSASSIGFGGDIYEELKKIYRAAFEKLEREGRIEEAAFVLAELLRESEQAVAFLERHGKLREAAQLAEGRQLPIGLVVRQWFLAGEMARAVALARVHGAFGDAIERLARTDPDRARMLRLLWADAQATAGDFLLATRLIEEIEGADGLRRAWHHRLLAREGAEAAVALVKLLALEPASFPRWRDRSLALLADGPDARLTLAEALQAAPPGPAAATLARATLRALAADAPALLAARSVDPARLLALADDQEMRIDWATPPRGSTPERNSLITMRVEAADRGPTAIFDAAVLPGGRILLALGELGVRLLSRQGRTIASFDQPAERLVLGQGGHRVIAVARRGDVHRLARIDVGALRSEVWAEAELESFASEFDGSLWFVAQRGVLLAIDATDPDFRALWRLNLPGPRVSSLAVGAGLRVLLPSPPPPSAGWQRRAGLSTTDAAGSAGGALEHWTFDLPSLRMTTRTEALPAPREPELYLQAMAGDLGVLVRRASDEGSLQWIDGTIRLIPLPACVRGATTSETGTLQIAGTTLAVTGPRGAAFLERSGESLVPAVEVTLDGASRVVARSTAAGQIIADDRGRVIVLDPARWRPPLSLRV